MKKCRFARLLTSAILILVTAGCSLPAPYGGTYSYDPAEESGQFLNNASVAVGHDFAVALDGSGVLLGAGSNKSGQLNFSSWQHVTALAAGDDFTVAAQSGDAVQSTSSSVDTSEWRDVIALDALSTHVLGLSPDGTVSAAGSNDNGQCDTGSWTDIVNIAAGDGFSAGLDSDGSVVMSGAVPPELDTSGWQGVLTISAGAQHLVGLTDSGQVLATGSNEYGQCGTGDWTDIVLICAGPYHTAGLKRDGTVVAAGRNDTGQCETSAFSDVVRIFAGEGVTIGLRSDGTLVGCGNVEYGSVDILQWDLSTDIPTESSPEATVSS